MSFGIYSLLYSYLLLLKTADVLTVIVSQLPVPMCKVKYTGIAVRIVDCHTTAGTRMPFGITQCYLPPAEVTFPPLPQPKLVLNLASLEGCKAELTWALQ